MTNLIRSLLLCCGILFLPPHLMATATSLGGCKADFTFAFTSDSTLLFFNTSTAHVSHVWTIEGQTYYNNDNGVLLSVPSVMPFDVCLTIEDADGCTDTSCLEISRDSPEAFCEQNECVWPGDTNGDWRANQYDLLNLGLGFGETGPPRESFPIEGEPTAWAPNTSADWDYWTNNSVNFKHLDCDGDGVVDASDVDAIIQNYRPDYNFSPLTTPGAPPVFLTFSTEVVEWDNTIGDDIVLRAKLMVGTEEVPVENLHGIALDFSYPFEWMEEGGITAEITADSPLLGPPEELLAVKYDLFHLGLGRYDLAASRQSTIGVTGAGAIFDLNFIVSGDIIDGLNEPISSFEIAVERVRMVDAQGDSIVYTLGETASVSIINSKLANTPTQPLASKVKLFPNPAYSAFNLQTTGGIIEAIELYDSQGRRLERRQVETSQTTIDATSLDRGLYWLKVQVDGDWTVKKVVVQ